MGRRAREKRRQWGVCDQGRASGCARVIARVRRRQRGSRRGWASALHASTPGLRWLTGSFGPETAAAHQVGRDGSREGREPLRDVM